MANVFKKKLNLLQFLIYFQFPNEEKRNKMFKSKSE